MIAHAWPRLTSATLWSAKGSVSGARPSRPIVTRSPRCLPPAAAQEAGVAGLVLLVGRRGALLGGASARDFEGVMTAWGMLKARR